MPTILATRIRGLAARMLWLSVCLASGCASTPRTPAGFDLGRAVTVGAVGWAAVSASNAESAEGVEQQRSLLLSREPATLPYPARWAEHLQEAANIRLAIERPIAAPARALRPMAEPLASGLTGVPLPAPRGVTRS